MGDFELVSLAANQFEEGDTTSAHISVVEVEEAVKLESSIPPDARRAVKDFIVEKLEELREPLIES